MSVLELKDVDAYYDKSHILFDVSLTVDEGECVALVGRNGAGKTTTLKSIMGLVDIPQGRITYNGEEITGFEPQTVAQRGIGFVPEHRRIVLGLTVQENLHLGYLGHEIERSESELQEFIFRFFPRLEERLEQNAGTMSGGEQQMLAIGRALMSEPDILLVDEPTEGLMPRHVETIRTILSDLHEQGLSILLVEQNVDLALDLSEHGYILSEGHMRVSDTAAALRENKNIKDQYLSV